MPDLIGTVYLLWSMNEQDEKEMADRLFKSSRETYNDALSYEIANLGCSGDGHLMNHEELSALRDRADSTAASVRKTFNRDLLRALESAQAEWEAEHGSRSGMTRAWLSKQMRQWENARSEWKSAQIAITEDTWVIDRARAAFYQHNPMQGQGRVRPDGAVCDICRSYVNRGWVSIDAAEAFEVPVHPNCPHWIEVKVTGGKPPCNELWRGES